MKIVVKTGDIYIVRLEDSRLRLFQFIGKDSTDLGGDVIRIFKTSYQSLDSVCLDSIVHDDVECYMHTSVIAGIKLGIWEKYAQSPIVGSTEIFFRSSQDYGMYPKQHIVSHNWVVWKMNGPRVFLGDLPEEYYNIDIGGVYAPSHVLFRLTTGSVPDKYYPDYK